MTPLLLIGPRQPLVSQSAFSLRLMTLQLPRLFMFFFKRVHCFKQNCILLAQAHKFNKKANFFLSIQERYKGLEEHFLKWPKIYCFIGFLSYYWVTLPDNSSVRRSSRWPQFGKRGTIMAAGTCSS